MIDRACRGLSDSGHFIPGFFRPQSRLWESDETVRQIWSRCVQDERSDLHLGFANGNFQQLESAVGLTPYPDDAASQSQIRQQLLRAFSLPLLTSTASINLVTSLANVTMLSNLSSLHAIHNWKHAQLWPLNGQHVIH
jgi:hypothetical protein